MKKVLDFKKLKVLDGKKDMEQLELSHIAARKINCFNYLESCLAVSFKVGHLPTL